MKFWKIRRLFDSDPMRSERAHFRSWFLCIWSDSKRGGLDEYQFRTQNRQDEEELYVPRVKTSTFRKDVLARQSQSEKRKLQRHGKQSIALVLLFALNSCKSIFCSHNYWFMLSFVGIESKESTYEMIDPKPSKQVCLDQSNILRTFKKTHKTEKKTTKVFTFPLYSANLRSRVKSPYIDSELVHKELEELEKELQLDRETQERRNEVLSTLDFKLTSKYEFR